MIFIANSEKKTYKLREKKYLKNFRKLLMLTDLNLEFLR